jgi:hypothetical protein
VAPPSAILSLQEVDPPAPDRRRNQEARKTAATMLDLLGTLQRDLLGAAASPAATAQLGQLIDAPSADDPALATIQRAIACRAAIELARWDFASPDPASGGDLPEEHMSAG